MATASTSTTAAAPALRERVALAKHSTVAVGIALLTRDGKTLPIGIGSGVVVAPHRVLTCAHVLQIPKLPPELKAVAYFVIRDDDWPKLGNPFTAFPATGQPVVDQRRDLALLTVPNLEAAPLAVGNASNVADGDDVFFIGHPRFENRDVPPPAVGTAIIAAKDTVTNGTHFYRLDGNVNHGNSGGALVSRSTGRLIGIVDAKEGDPLAPMLQAFKDHPPSARIILSGTDPVVILQQTLNQMQDSMQLGIGLAVDAGELQQFLSTN